MAYRERKFGDRREEPGNYAAKNRIDPRNRTGAAKNAGFRSCTKAETKSGFRKENEAGSSAGRTDTGSGTMISGSKTGRRENTRKEAGAEWKDSAREAAEETGDAAVIEGRNAVLEAFRAGRPIDRLYIQDGCHDGPVLSIKREAQKCSAMIKYVEKERLDQLSETGRHQGVIAIAAAYEYASVEDILEAAKAGNEPPFLILLDNIEDPHNLGAIIRTANLAGAHGVIIPKNRAVGLTATVARTSAGALNYTPVAKVTNLAKTIEDLKKEGMWFVCADMDGTSMYRLDLKGPIGLVIGSEGEGVSRLVKENSPTTPPRPQPPNRPAPNATGAAGVLAYEIVRQRLGGGA